MKKSILTTIGLSAAYLIYAQSLTGNCDPDSLDPITVTGIVQVEATGNHAQYYLTADETVYHLNFGPWWYEPSEGEAERPLDEDFVEIEGGLNATNPGTYPVIVVYRIDGEFWRNPYDPGWNHFNDQFTSDPESFTDGIACGWPDSLTIMDTFSGVIKVDTTLKYIHYFLDTDFDELPDYKLNFGPPWYTSPDSTELPTAGDTVVIEGAIVHVSTYPILIVFTIDGELWRDDTGFGPARFGKWMNGNENGHLTITSPFDTLSQVRFQNGWHHGRMPGNYMYCQMLEIHHRNVYRQQEQNAFAGFEVAFFDEHHNNLMFGQQGHQEMKFNKQVRVQFHYTKRQLQQIRAGSECSIHLYCLDPETASWLEEENIFVDTDNQLVTLQTHILQSFYILTAEELTASTMREVTGNLRVRIRPNPMASSASVELLDATGGNVDMMLFDISGNLVSARRRIPVKTNPGTIYINTSEIAEGMYYLRILAGHRSATLPIAVLR